MSDSEYHVKALVSAAIVPHLNECELISKLTSPNAADFLVDDHFGDFLRGLVGRWKRDAAQL
jgi:hypothetical protein